MNNILKFQLLQTTLFFICSLTCKSQNMIVKSVAVLPTDKTAMQYPCIDNNGDTCALLKIKTDNLEGIEFSK